MTSPIQSALLNSTYKVQRRSADVESIIIPNEDSGVCSTTDSSAASTALPEDWIDWHHRLCHLVDDEWIRQEMELDLPTVVGGRKCEHCSVLKRTPAQQFKQFAKLKEPKSKHPTECCLELTHCAVIGPFTPSTLPSTLGHRFMIVMVDHYSRHVTAYTVQEEYEILDKIRAHIKEHSYKEKEETEETEESNEKKKTQKVCLESCIDEFLSCVDSSGVGYYQNDKCVIGKSVNNLVFDVVKIQLTAAGLAESYWAEALGHVIQTLNRLPHPVTGTAPLSRWNPKADPMADLKLLRVFGCKIEVLAILLAFNERDDDCRFESYRTFIPSTEDYFDFTLQSRCFESIFPGKSIYHLSSPNLTVTLTKPQLYQRHLWHARLCHVGSNVINTMIMEAEAYDYLQAPYEQCRQCNQVDEIRTRLASQVETSRSLDLVHVDLLGPFEPSFVKLYSNETPKKYLLTLVDDYTRHIFIYFLRECTSLEVTEELNRFISKHHHKKWTKIGGMRFYPRLAEFKQNLSDLLLINNISMDMCDVNVGLGPSTNQLLEVVSRNLLTTAGLPRAFWLNSMHYAMHTLNRVIHPDFLISGEAKFQPVSTQSPFDRFHNHKQYSKVNYFKLFGCEMRFIESKISEREQSGIFLGYISGANQLAKRQAASNQPQVHSTPSDHRHWYLCLMQNGDMVVVQNAKFFENNFPHQRYRLYPKEGYASI